MSRGRFGPVTLIVAAFCGLAAWACSEPSAAPAPRDQNAVEALASARDPDAHAESLTFVERTTGGASGDQRLPMLVVLHGLGDTPEHFLEVFTELSTKARLIAVRAPDRWSVGTSWYPIDGAPEEKARAITRRARAVAELARTRASARPTLGKPVVTGFSQGGVLSFALAAQHADQFFAAVPIAGALPAEMPAPSRAPAWFSLLAFHGESDRRIPFMDGDAAVRRLQAAGFRASMTSFAGVGHGIPDAMHAQITSALDELLDRAPRE